MVHVKICGLTNLRDALTAAEAGADMLGFIFYPGSPRYVSPDQARVVVTALHAQYPHVRTVGVFVNETPATVWQILEYCGIQLAQLHGEEPAEWLKEPSVLAGRAYKALRPRSQAEADRLAAEYALLFSPAEHAGIPSLLVDAYHITARGGSGQLANWDIAARLAQRYPLLLAGGLTSGNVTRAIQHVRPWGVDVASGVEQAPGRKDPVAMRTFIHFAKATCCITEDRSEEEDDRAHDICQ
ncbi:MAG: N-(5'-phosphoribosyl)anthranilate isomerase [Ardenticatenia bacterium]|jgi:phosphoribosylanthranilate isomerase|nr:MAG: N-(5'-phosphoribosyl)anthranilate isomerase [Ardenticatenia bacterium]